MRVLVTGSKGFIGKNLLVTLSEMMGHEVFSFNRENTPQDLEDFIIKSDFIIHLAGVNRPEEVADFAFGNINLTARICEIIISTGRNIPLILTSSIHAERNSPYGDSKRAAEQVVEAMAKLTGNAVFIYRLPGVFGKWCRPNYNSVVATYCHNTANDLPIKVENSELPIELVYIDDVIADFLNCFSFSSLGMTKRVVSPSYTITLGKLADQIEAFKNCRSSLVSESVGDGLVRALYSTYVSYLPPSKFSYDLPRYIDNRGTFVEILKTKDCGQFSFFTANPGVTRGIHYHHTKTEKFLVISGNARFRFRHILTNERYEIFTNGDQPKIVESVPGWSHDITNIGQEEMVVVLWANEIFDRMRPDTIASKI